jgi:hypothetical protein
VSDKKILVPRRNGRRKVRKLEWKYCECGCHGSELRIGDFSRWSYTTFPVPNDYTIQKIRLQKGHMFGEYIMTFSSSVELDKFVQNELDEQIKKMGGRTK